LKHTEGDIPWPVLEQFAEALVADPGLAAQLRSRYEEIMDSEDAPLDYEYVYIPAIFALAAPRLDEATRRQAGEFLVRELLSAGENDDDVLLETLEAACGSLGPVVLPRVLQTLEDLDAHHNAWFHLWSVATVAMKAEDPALRERVARQAMEVLGRAERGELDVQPALGAVWPLAKMRHDAARPLIQRLYDQTGLADLSEELEILDGTQDFPVVDELWQKPVREWLVGPWEQLREEYEGGGEEDEDEEAEEAEEAEELIQDFLDSREVEALPEAQRDDAGFVVECLLNYGRDYVDATPKTFTESKLEELLLEVFPRKVSAERELFENVAPVTALFLRWLGATGVLPRGAHLADTVKRWGERIAANAMDPRNWGMAKGLVMRAQAEGVDVENQAEFDSFVDRYNRQIVGEHLDGGVRQAHPALSLPKGGDDEGDGDDLAEDEGEEDWEGGGVTPPVEVKPSVGRNDPCPCGSGKKYKKCCGR